jgi:hypothetical protein
MSQCNYDIWAITAYSYAYIGVVIPIGTARNVFDPNIFGGGLIRYGDKTVSRRGIRLLLSRLFERGSDQLRAYDVPEEGEERIRKVSVASKRAN